MIPIVSYAQNFEDVMLWRALQHVENGFYIDIGAHDPVIDSVSLAFHEHGWRGIHVEPTPHYAQLLRDQRPGDLVIEAAVADQTDLITFFEIPDTGISTADPEIAQQHRERGFDVHEITVPCVKLSSVFKTCVGQEIHWMKIDVEGYEKSVLSSWGKSKVRPWIVVVESTLPLSQVETHDQWESNLLRRGYAHVYFDGLNRYYVSKEKVELKEAFNAPPNVFDQFLINGTASTFIHYRLRDRHAAELQQALDRVKQVDDKAREQSTQLDAKTAEMMHVEEMLRAEILGLKETTLQMSADLVAAKDEFAVAVQAAYDESLASTHALTAREREFASQGALQEQSYRTELSTLQAEYVRANGLLIAAKDEFADALRSVHLEAVKATQSLIDREHEFNGQLIALQRDHHAEVAALNGEVSRLSALLVAAKQDHVELLQLTREKSQRAAEALATTVREHENEVANNLLRITAERDTVKRLQAECQRLEQAREDYVGIHKKQESTIGQLNLEARQLRAHLLEANGGLVSAATRLQDRDLKISQLTEQFVGEITQLRAALFTSAAQKQKWLIRHVSEKSSHRLHDRFALVAPLLEIEAMVRNSISPPNEKAGDMEQQRFLRAIFQPGFEINTSDTYHIDDFLVLHDKAFVQACYLALLKREADLAGMDFYVGRVRAGVSKAQIIEEITLSAEAREKGVHIVGLKEAIRRRWWYELPLIGRVLVAMSFLANLSSYLQDLRVLENHVVRSAEQIQTVNEVNLNNLNTKITAK